MSVVASQLIAEVKAIGAAGAKADLLSVGEASDHAGSLMKTALLGAAVAAGAALIGISVASVKMAGNFQQATNQLVTSAGLSRDSIGAVRQGILDLSVSTATSTDQLAKGMFNVQSALHLGAGGLEVLKAAAEGAKAENSDLAQTTDVLTTAMVNYHLAASQAVPTMNSLIVTVADGKMHMDDLTGSLKNVLPVSAAFHIKLSDVEGALATMANAGDRGTAAGTHLAMMFKMLSSPTSTAAGEMKAMGLDSVKLAQTMQTSLPDALKMIQDAVSKHFTPGSVEYNRAIQAILGGSKSGMAGLELFGQGLKALGNNTNDAAAALRKGGKDVENWDIIQGNFNFKLDAAKNAVSALMIEIGTRLLPVVSKVLDVITPLVTAFGQWISSSNGLGAAIKSVGTSLQPVSVMFQDLGHFLGTLDFSGLTGSFRVLATTIGSIFSSLQGGGKGGPSAFDFFNNLDVAIKGLISGGVSNLTTIFQQLSKTLVELRPTFSEISNIIGGVFAGHMKTASDITQELGKWWQTTLAPAIQKAMPAFEQLARVLITDVVPGLLKIWAVGEQFYDTVARALVPILEKAIPFFIRLESVIASGLAPALQFLMPYIVQAAQAIGQFADEIITRVAPIIEQWFDQMDKGLTAFLQIWNAVWPYLAPILQGVWDEIVGVVKIAWALVKGIVEIGLDLLSGNWSQAWEDFKTMLSGVWDGIKQILKGAWEIIAGWATGAWKLIASAISAPIQAVGNWLAGAWNTFKNDASTTWHNISSTISGIVTGITTWLVTAWQNTVNTVVGWFDWLYNHNYYFKALVDFIHDTTSAIRDWLISTWQSITGWIGDKWNWLAGQASTIWHAVSGFISSATNTAVNFLHGVWNSVIGWLSGVWNTISSKVQQGWSTISGIFSSAWGRYIAGPLGSLGNSIGGFFGNLANQAFTWGKNVIQGIIDGINNMLGPVGDAASNVASKITGVLGFHSPPKEGPAHDSDKWAPAFINMFTSGLQAGMPKIEGMVAKLAKPLAVNLKPSSSAFAGGNLQLPSLAAASSGTGQPMQINLNVDGQTFASLMVDHMGNAIMRKTTLKHSRRVF